MIYNENVQNTTVFCIFVSGRNKLRDSRAIHLQNKREFVNLLSLMTNVYTRSLL